MERFQAKEPSRSQRWKSSSLRIALSNGSGLFQIVSSILSQVNNRWNLKRQGPKPGENRVPWNNIYWLISTWWGFVSVWLNLYCVWLLICGLGVATLSSQTIHFEVLPTKENMQIRGLLKCCGSAVEFSMAVKDDKVADLCWAVEMCIHTNVKGNGVYALITALAGAWSVHQLRSQVNLEWHR